MNFVFLQWHLKKKIWPDVRQTQPPGLLNKMMRNANAMMTLLPAVLILLLTATDSSRGQSVEAGKKKISDMIITKENAFLSWDMAWS